MMGGEAIDREAGRMSAKGLYDPPATGPLAGLEPAQIENILLRAVLADLKAGGWDPASISNRSKCELGERLRLATGLPLRSITGFLRISRSSYEYHRARLGRDKYARLREEVREVFEEGGRVWGYRTVRARLGRRGVRVSEKVVRRIMREEGLLCRTRRRRKYRSYMGQVGKSSPNLLARDSIAVAADPAAVVEVFDSYPYGEGVGEFTQANADCERIVLTESHACGAAAHAASRPRSRPL